MRFSCALVVAVWLAAVMAAQTPNLPNGPAVVDYLNQSIDWHRQIAVEQQLASDPADVLFLNDARQLANQALQLSFDFAKADAELLAKAKPAAAASEGENGAEPSAPQSLAQAAAAADAEVRARQADIQSLKKQSETAKGRKRRTLDSQIAALQSELELEQTRRDTLRGIVQFVGGRGGSHGDLTAQIEALQRSVPELESSAGGPAGKPANAAAAPAARAQPSGVISLVEDLFGLHRKKHTLKQAVEATEALSAAGEKLRAPLVAQLTSIAKQGDAIVKQANASDPAQLANEKGQLDALTSQFKGLAAAALPLGKQSILLEGYKRNLQRWNSLVDSQSELDLKRLAVRLVLLGIALAVVIALAEIWRKAIFRYVHDVRRRYQFLLLRRIIIWIAVAIAIAFALASEIGSLATFVGLITAGIAVALQNVILAIAGYFFLIGKFGVRVGDRVQIGGVVGDVIDVGLIRLHLMEVGDARTGRQPTGRVVVFSNAIVFQPGASFYKQIPGTSFMWHEVSMTLAPNTDYQLAEKRMLEAVEAVYADYKHRMEEQHQQMEQTLSVSVAVPRPQSRLQFTDGGLVVVIRYPTELDNAAEIDDAVTRRLLQAIEQSPRLKLVGSGTPNIQAVSEEPEPQPKAS